MRGEEIALGALGEQLERLVIQLELKLPRARAQPAGRAARLSTGQICTQAPWASTARTQSAPCASRSRRGVEDQEQRVADRRPREAPRALLLPARRACRSTGGSRAARRAPNSDRIARRAAHFIPVGGALDKVHFALAESLRARGGADGVRCLAAQQRLVPGDEVGRQEPLVQVTREGVGSELQMSGPVGANRRASLSTIRAEVAAWLRRRPSRAFSSGVTSVKGGETR